MAGLAIVKYSLFSQEKYTDARYKHQTLEVAINLYQSTTSD